MASPWQELKPEPAAIAALEQAGAEATRQDIRDELERVRSLESESQRRRERAVLRDMRKRWSERFARACATMLANQLRTHNEIRRRFEVTPDQDGQNQEAFTPLGYRTGKRIDVVVSGPLVGLQLGVSLKGLNFADDASGNHDKNLTGRLYELRDEVSTVHDYLPRAFMATVFFLPVAACFDKSTSSFAHVAMELTARTIRLDPTVAAHGWRCDFGAVGLYAPGDPEDQALGIARGALRFFPIQHKGGAGTPLPQRGLPTWGATLDLPMLVDRIVDDATNQNRPSVTFASPDELGASGSPIADVAPPEGDAPDGYNVDDDEDLEEGEELGIAD